MNCDQFQQLCATHQGLASDAVLATQWELHLLACADCAAFYANSVGSVSVDAQLQQSRQDILSATLGARDETDEQLRNLQSIEPPAELLAGVLARTAQREQAGEQTAETSAFEQHWAAFIRPLEKFFQSAMRRPRIALEASFAFTFCWVAAFGLPTSMVANAAGSEAQLQQPLENSRRFFNRVQQEFSDLMTSVQQELKVDPDSATSQGENP